LDGANLVSNLHRWLLGRVGRVEGLVVGEAVQVLVVLIIDFHVVFAVRVRVEVVEEAKEDLEGDQAVRASLMLAAHPHDAQLLCNLLQAAVQVKTVHERLDVEDVGDVVDEELFEKLARCRQIFVHHQFDQEAEVLVAVEANPGEAIVEDQARGHDFLGEVERADAVVLEAVEVQAALFELVDGDLSLALGVDVPVEVELPSGDWLWQVAVLVTERDAQLDYL
jgi:hypothetical protein